MKFFIFMCCTAHLLTGISSRLRRTTPMTSALRSGDAEERQVARFAEMIDYVNSVPDNDGRRRSFAKRLDSRRLNEVMAAMYAFADLKGIRNVDNFDIMREIEEKVRHDIVDDPDVLMEHRVRHTDGYTEAILEDTPFDASQYSTAENKWDDFRVAPEVTADVETNITLNDNATSTPHDNATVKMRRRAQINVQKSTTNKNTYLPSFSDDEDEEKSITDGIKLKNIYNERNIDEEHPVVPTDINKSYEFQDRTPNNKPSSKNDNAQINKKKEATHDSKETGTNEENNKEYSPITFIYSKKKLNKDSIHPKDEPDEKTNKETVASNEKGGFDKNQKDRSGDKNDSNLKSVERLIFKRDNNLHSNRDRMEQHSIYLHRGRSENSKKQSTKRHEKIDRMKERVHDIRDERGSQWIKVDTQKDYKDSLEDRKEDRWGKKEKDWDKNHDEWSNKEKYWTKNYGRLNEKQKDWDDDDRWHHKEKDWDDNDTSNNKDKYNDGGWPTKVKYGNHKIRNHDKDKGFDTMEYEWMKRHQRYGKHESDAQLDNNDHQRNEKSFKQIDNYYMKRDSELNERDNDWNKRDSGEYKNRDRTYHRNDSGNKKSYESVDQDSNLRHDRYKVVDRVDSLSSGNDDFERSSFSRVKQFFANK